MATPVVCQVLHSLHVGGAEILAANLARRLRDRFHFVFVCLDELGSQGEQLRREGFEIEVIGRKSGIDWKSMKRLASYLSRRQVSLLHAHQYTPFFYAAASGLFTKRPALLFTEHGRWYPDRRSRKRVVFNRLMLRKRDRVVGVGEHVRRALIDNEGISADRVKVIYNGVNLHAFNNGDGGSDARAQLRSELGIASDTLIVLQVARLDALKDHVTAVNAMANIVKARTDIHLVLAGDGPERASIQTAIRNHSLQNHVHLLGTRNDVGRLLKSADLFLLTSISEGIPLTVIEAMAAGLPVVSTSAGGVPEVVEQGKTGFLCPPKDSARLADAILQLADDESLRGAMGSAGRIRAQELFSDERMNASYAQMYSEMLAG